MVVTRFGYTHPEGSACKSYDCKPVERNEAKPGIPEFTVTVKYISISRTWQYALDYQHPKYGPKGEAAKGYKTEAAAMGAAEDRAREIAKSLVPPVVYKFTPNIGGTE